MKYKTLFKLFVSKVKYLSALLPCYCLKNDFSTFNLKNYSFLRSVSYFSTWNLVTHLKNTLSNGVVFAIDQESTQPFADTAVKTPI